MRKFALIFICVFSFVANISAAEIYDCKAPKGWDNIKGKINETGVFSSYIFIISGNEVIVEFGKENLDYPVRLLRNSAERIDIVGMAKFTTELFTINKKENKLYYVKNGIIGNGYSMMMSSDCKRK